MKASLYGHASIVRTLLEYGADVTVKSKVRNRMMMLIMIVMMTMIIILLTMMMLMIYALMSTEK